MSRKVLADTNILLDIMLRHRPGCESATSLLHRSAGGDIDIAICAGSLKDAYYIARKDLPETARRHWNDVFLKTFTVLPMNKDVCLSANRSDEPDFEDGIIRQCAEDWKADYILSQDRTAFGMSTIPRISGDELSAIIDDNAR